MAKTHLARRRRACGRVVSLRPITRSAGWGEQAAPVAGRRPPRRTRWPAASRGERVARRAPARPRPAALSRATSSSFILPPSSVIAPLTPPQTQTARHRAFPSDGPFLIPGPRTGSSWCPTSDHDFSRMAGSFQRKFLDRSPGSQAPPGNPPCARVRLAQSPAEPAARRVPRRSLATRKMHHSSRGPFACSAAELGGITFRPSPGDRATTPFVIVT
jgi:hypothetical protein